MSDDYRRPLTDVEREMVSLDHVAALAMNYWYDGIMTEEEVRRAFRAWGLA